MTDVACQTGACWNGWPCSFLWLERPTSPCRPSDSWRPSPLVRETQALRGHRLRPRRSGGRGCCLGVRGQGDPDRCRPRCRRGQHGCLPGLAVGGTGSRRAETFNHDERQAFPGRGGQGEPETSSRRPGDIAATLASVPGGDGLGGGSIRPGTGRGHPGGGERGTLPLVDLRRSQFGHHRRRCDQWCVLRVDDHDHEDRPPATDHGDDRIHHHDHDIDNHHDGGGHHFEHIGAGHVDHGPEGHAVVTRSSPRRRRQGQPPWPVGPPAHQGGGSLAGKESRSASSTASGIDSALSTRALLRSGGDAPWGTAGDSPFTPASLTGSLRVRRAGSVVAGWDTMVR